VDFCRTRAASRRAEMEAIALGNEPPLSVDGGAAGLIDRRRVSAQWFSGTILTGLCGAALMGGAVFAALDGETNFADLPERFEAAVRNAVGNTGDKLATRKSDKLPPVGDANVARQVFRVSTATKVGDREVMRVRPFVRVTTNLALSTSELSANIPPFNAQRMISDAGSDGAPVQTDEAPGSDPDAEVFFVTRDLAAVLPKAKVVATVPMEDILARVRDAANWTGGGSENRYMLASLPSPGMKLAYATEGDSDPYAGFEARIVPENITLLPKTAGQTTGGNSWSERAITVKKGESILSILRDLGAAPEDIKAIAAVLGPRGREGGLQEGQKLRVLMTATSDQRQQPIRVIIAGDTAIEAAVALSDSGKYVPVDVQSINTEIAEKDDDEEDDGSGVRLYQSIYETALRHQVPRSVIESLIRIYSYDVDFQRKVKPGDALDILYVGDDETAAADSKPDVLLASLTIGGEAKKFYRFQTPDDGLVDYYDESGKSAKKFLVRKPVGDGIMRSGFGVRRHPILGYSKMHTGVDWAAPLGTPIYAAGSGAVERVGWESGYGKYVRIRHANGYETAYGHMTAFARSTQAGARVRQGQVIGFVGSTGQSTGAHLHFEVLVNGRFVDPMRIRLPRGRVLESAMLSNFERERERIDGMGSRGGPKVAQNQTKR
jgi:murein DD-endopeptidase MepM/ murein hydrolase activator NlpD